MSITLTYSLPHELLSPNESPNRYKKQRLIKKRRRNVMYETIMHVRNAGMKDDLRWKHVTATIMWYHKTWQRPDRDNVIAWLKSTFDGIEESGLILNDKYLRPMPPEFQEDKERPRVEITLMETDADGKEKE